MDLLNKEEPLINLKGCGSAEDGDDLMNDKSFHSRRLCRNRQNRLSSGSMAYVRELSPARKDQSMERHNSVIVSAVERTMKNYADGVLRVLEGMSGRLSQLELTSQYLERSVASLKGSVDDYHDNFRQNFKSLNERVTETHRSLQILRDKQDIFEAHAQLEKLQTSKAKESARVISASGTAESSETLRSHPQQEHSLQVQPQLSLPSEQHLPPQQHMQQAVPTQLSMQQPSVSTQQPTQQLLQLGQPHVSQPPHISAQQYQVPRLQSQMQGLMQHVQQDARMQLASIAVMASEQVQYQAQQQQVPPPVTPSPQPLQVTTQQIHQPTEHIHHIPASPQMHTQEPLSQQVAGQQPPRVEGAQFLAPPQQRQIQQSAPHQPSFQQPMQVQPQIHGQILTQPPPQMQKPPSSCSQGSFQYYGELNDSQRYALLAQGTSSSTPGGYTTETSCDSSYASSHPPPSSMSAQQAPPRPPVQMAMSLPHSIPLQDPNAAGGQAVWNRQANSPILSTIPRLQTAQPVRADYSSTETNAVVEKVVAMGFSREQVQSVIRRLGERNQLVDMNVVLDILMNGSQGGLGR